LIEQLLGLAKNAINLVDIGAAFFGEPAPYQPLLDNGLAKLFAFEPDEREIERLQRHLGQRGQVIPCAVGDGRAHTFHICPKQSGMSSLLEPDPASLGFFNLFVDIGRVESTKVMPTRRLDDIDELPQIDFCKMDCQGSELMILANGRKKLSDCVAIQTEVSFITLYKNQPTFGDIDQELRRQGFIPHRFTEVKCWSITPIVRNNEPRLPFNQLLEGDIVYVRNIIQADRMSDLQLSKLAAISHLVCKSPDLAGRCILELQKRGSCDAGTITNYLQAVR
jgi:FkbM family methyltransferase